MRLSVNQGKNNPIYDAYLLITTNTNNLDGDGGAQFYSGGTVEQITQNAACRSLP